MGVAQMPIVRFRPKCQFKNLLQMPSVITLGARYIETEKSQNLVNVVWELVVLSTIFSILHYLGFKKCMTHSTRSCIHIAMIQYENSWSTTNVLTFPFKYQVTSPGGVGLNFDTQVRLMVEP